jgi:hypothetical protein
MGFDIRIDWLHAVAISGYDGKSVHRPAREDAIAITVHSHQARRCVAGKETEEPVNDTFHSPLKVN